jgi:hypothetical protein
MAARRGDRRQRSAGLQATVGGSCLIRKRERGPASSSSQRTAAARGEAVRQTGIPRATLQRDLKATERDVPERFVSVALISFSLPGI